MKFAIDIPNFGSDFANVRLVAEVAYEAEQAGWDGFFIWDHIGANWGELEFNDPWVELTAIAMRTERIRLGTLVTPLPRRRPWKLSREVVTLDQLSGGRVILGVGIGGGNEGLDDEYSAYHEVRGHRLHGEMLDEGLEILTGLWSGKEFSYAGQHYQIENVLHLPSPVQQPRIPIWVAGWWPNRKPMRRAARWDGAYPLPRDEDLMTPAALQECLAYIRSQQTPALAAQPYDLVHAGRLTREDEPAERALIEGYASVGVTWWLDHPRQGETLAEMRPRIRKGPPSMR